MKMKKLFAVTAALCICLNMAACGKTAEEKPAETTSKATTTTVSTTATETTTTEATTTEKSETKEKTVYQPCQEILDADLNSGLVQIGNTIFHIGGYYTIDQFIEEYKDSFNVTHLNTNASAGEEDGEYIFKSLYDPDLWIAVDYAGSTTRLGDAVVMNVRLKEYDEIIEDVCWYPKGIGRHGNDLSEDDIYSMLKNIGITISSDDDSSDADISDPVAAAASIVLDTGNYWVGTDVLEWKEGMKNNVAFRIPSPEKNLLNNQPAYWGMFDYDEDNDTYDFTYELYTYPDCLELIEDWRDPNAESKLEDWYEQLEREKEEWDKLDVHEKAERLGAQIYEPCQEIIDADYDSGLVQIGNDVFRRGGYYTVDRFMEEYGEKYDMSKIRPDETTQYNEMLDIKPNDDEYIGITVYAYLPKDVEECRIGDLIVYDIESWYSLDIDLNIEWYPHGIPEEKDDFDYDALQDELEGRGFTQVEEPYKIYKDESGQEWKDRSIAGNNTFWLNSPKEGNSHMTDILGFRIKGTDVNLYGQIPIYTYYFSAYTDSGEIDKTNFVSSTIYNEDEEVTKYTYSIGWADKPVIYLYPEEETQVDVKLEPQNAEFWTTYPKYDNGWSVTAAPDGKLTDKDGHTYNYLFWDAIDWNTYDMSKGFCVKGEDTVDFLREKLTLLGLNESEMNEFITYWLPRMEHNEYNLVAFQTEDYEKNFPLTVTPKPDSMLRVFMTYKPLDEYVEIEPQQLHGFERKGFAVVEWGGSELGEDHVR